jgi:hypothetical protein
LFTLVVGTLAGLITSISFFIDIGLVASVRSKVKKDTSGDLQLNWGNAVCLSFWVVELFIDLRITGMDGTRRRVSNLGVSHRRLCRRLRPQE